MLITSTSSLVAGYWSVIISYDEIEGNSYRTVHKHTLIYQDSFCPVFGCGRKYLLGLYAYSLVCLSIGRAEDCMIFLLYRCNLLMRLDMDLSFIFRYLCLELTR